MAVRQWRRRRYLLLIPLTLLMMLLLVDLPYDNPIRMGVHFFLAKLTIVSDEWLTEAPAFPLSWRDDVGIILKSGYGTRERISPWLESAQHTCDLIIVADFATKSGNHYNYHGRRLPVQDVMAMMLDQGWLPQDSHPRLDKYRKLNKAITVGNSALARNLSTSFGWELDAMKVRRGPPSFHDAVLC
jgi:hypothetical protein